MRGRTEASIRRAKALGAEARARGDPISSNPYRDSAWGLAGPWRVGWTQEDVKRGGGLAPRPPKLPTQKQRQALLWLASGSWVDLENPGVWHGTGRRYWPIVDGYAPRGDLHEVTWRALKGRHLVAAENGRGVITEHGLRALPEVRAVRTLAAKPHLARIFPRTVTPAVLGMLTRLLWISNEQRGDGGWTVTDRGMAEARVPKKT